MADNSNPAVMIDLDFARYSHLGLENTSTTAYTRADFRKIIAEHRAQGWSLTSIDRVIH